MAVTFNACGPAVIVKHPPVDSGYRVLLIDWREKKKWCEDQGWTANEDFLAPGSMVNAKWYFRTTEQQVLFTLRWA